MNSSMKEKQTHRHREQTCGCQGVGVGEGLGVWGQQMQTIVYRMDKQQVILYNTGNYTQYPVINHNGKEYEKECVNIYIYIYIYN